MEQSLLIFAVMGIPCLTILIALIVVKIFEYKQESLRLRYKNKLNPRDEKNISKSFSLPQSDNFTWTTKTYKTYIPEKTEEFKNVE